MWQCLGWILGRAAQVSKEIVLWPELPEWEVPEWMEFFFLHGTEVQIKVDEIMSA